MNGSHTLWSCLEYPPNLMLYAKYLETERFRRSFVPTATRLFNSDCWHVLLKFIYFVIDYYYYYCCYCLVCNHCIYIYHFLSYSTNLNFPHWGMNKVFFYSIFYSILFLPPNKHFWTCNNNAKHSRAMTCFKPLTFYVAAITHLVTVYRLSCMTAFKLKHWRGGITQVLFFSCWYNQLHKRSAFLFTGLFKSQFNTHSFFWIALELIAAIIYPPNVYTPHSFTYIEHLNTAYGVEVGETIWCKYLQWKLDAWWAIMCAQQEKLVRKTPQKFARVCRRGPAVFLRK